MTATGYKVNGHCIPGCQSYGFDHSFWQATMITEWDLVCEDKWLKTFAKLLLFSGKSVSDGVMCYLSLTSGQALV